jgi:hypothetical protein
MTRARHYTAALTRPMYEPFDAGGEPCYTLLSPHNSPRWRGEEVASC